LTLKELKSIIKLKKVLTSGFLIVWRTFASAYASGEPVLIFESITGESIESICGIADVSINVIFQKGVVEKFGSWQEKESSCADWFMSTFGRRIVKSQAREVVRIPIG